MKRLMISVCFVLLFSSVLLFSERKFIFTVHGNYFNVIANSGTNQTAKKKVIVEGKAAVSLFGNFYCWGSFGAFPISDNWTEWSNKTVFDKDVNVDRTLKKSIISGGIGYYVGYFEPEQFAIKIELGLCKIRNVIDSTYSYIATKDFIRSSNLIQKGLGIRTNLGVTYGLLKKVFGEVAISFLYASDTKDSVKSKLGGLSVSAGIGIVL